MQENFVITISRQFGSGGRQIGERLAEKLGLPFYDKTLIELAAGYSELAPEFIAEAEDAGISKSMLFHIAIQGYSDKSMRIKDNPYVQNEIYIAQRKAIRELAARESCVIVGRCANYILQDHPHCLHAFIYSDMESRIQRAVADYGLSPDDIEKTLQKRDRLRAEHYHHYTRQEWGHYQNYHVSLYSDFFGLEVCAEMLEKMALAL